MSSGLLHVFVELWNLHGTSNYIFIESTGVACSDSVSHNQVQVLSIPLLLLACSQDWTCNLQLIVSLEKVKVPEFDKHLKKAGGHIGRNIVEITIKIKTIVQKHLMIKIIKLRLRNLDNKHLKKAGGHIGQNVVEITIKTKTIVRKPLMITITKLRLRNFDN